MVNPFPWCYIKTAFSTFFLRTLKLNAYPWGGLIFLSPKTSLRYLHIISLKSNADIINTICICQYWEGRRNRKKEEKFNLFQPFFLQHRLKYRLLHTSYRPIVCIFELGVTSPTNHPFYPNQHLNLPPLSPSFPFRLNRRIYRLLKGFLWI